MFLILVAVVPVSEEGDDVVKIFEDIATRVLDARLKFSFDKIEEKIEEKCKDQRRVFNGMFNVTAVQSASRNTEYIMKRFLRKNFQCFPLNLCHR